MFQAIKRKHICFAYLLSTSTSSLLDLTFLHFYFLRISILSTKNPIYKIFSSKFNAIAAIYILGLVLNTQDAAGMSLFGKTYQLSDLPTIPSQEFTKFGPRSVSIKSAFACADGVCYTEGRNGINPITIACGSDNQNNIKDRTLQVYKSLPKFNPKKTKPSSLKDLILRSTTSFKLKDGICYIAPNICHVNLRQYKPIFNGLPKEKMIATSASLGKQIQDGMNELYNLGWLYDLKAENICVNNGKEIVLYNYKNARPEPITSSNKFEHIEDNPVLT
ncbi:hypothetical protein BDF19DRAFT_426505 [Syncephalis fuscata]|nr:hypothetical protein BDF19DRAFT_426505 [Syncephalis fuscata]